MKQDQHYYKVIEDFLAEQDDETRISLLDFKNCLLARAFKRTLEKQHPKLPVEVLSSSAGSVTLFVGPLTYTYKTDDNYRRVIMELQYLVKESHAYFTAFTLIKFLPKIAEVTSMEEAKNLAFDLKRYSLKAK